MTERGLPIVDGAPACPFVAFEDDRDERATSPDHRHRCYAEAQPAPRALAHQEAYCLSSAFPVCPTFQDWARREAARTRGQAAPRRDEDDLELPPIAADEPPRRSGPHVWSAPPPWLRGGPRPPDGVESEGPAGLEGPVAGAGGAGGAAGSAGGAAGAAGGGAGAAGAGAVAAGGLAGSFADRLASGQPGSPSGMPPAAAMAPDWDERDAWEDDADQASEPVRPPRPGAPAATTGGAGSRPDPRDEASLEDLPSAPRRRGRERLDAGRDEDARERDLWAPSWERPRRLEAYPTLRSRRLGAIALPPLLVALVAVILAGAALFFLPSFLGVGAPGGGGSPAPSTTASLAASFPITPTAVPEATPTTYTVQANDTMSRIAKKFNVPLADLIAANAATIPNPDQLAIGDVVIIPTATPSELPAASTAP